VGGDQEIPFDKRGPDFFKNSFLTAVGSLLLWAKNKEKRKRLLNSLLL